MKRILFSLLLCSVYLFVINANDDVLIKINDRKITSDEFLRIYNKNNNNNTIDNKSIKEYLDLFINFKLKVIEAEELGYDTMPVFINEFEKYRKQLVKPYLVDKEAQDNLIKELYERMKWEISASHILITIGRQASPEDTLIAYNKIMEIRQRILNGENFNEVARATSEDPSAKMNGGELGYFTAFSMVFPFENAAYNTKVGDISMPVRSSFGFHILKVEDKRPYRGEIKVAHIMKMVPNGSSPDFKDSMKTEIFKIYDKIKAGEDFAELAKKYSDDKSTGAKGGELPWFSSTSRIIAEFVNACFTLKDNGDISEPFETQYGWHIVKKLDSRGLKSYDELKDEIAEKIKRDPNRNILSEDKAVEKLKKEYNFTEDLSKLEYLSGVVTDKVFSKKWNASACESNETIFTLDTKNYTQKDLADYIEKTQSESSPYSIPIYVTEKYKSFVKQSVLDYEESRLDEKYPEYRYLVQEYHDGILLFNLTDEMVWSKAVKDTVGLHEFYMNHINDYMWNERVDATIYSSDNTDKIKALSKILKKSDKEKSEAVEMVCDSTNLQCVNFENGLYEKGDNEMIDKIKWQKGVSKPIKKDNQLYIVQIKNILPEQSKTFEEATGIITSDYQNYLDKQWISELKSKYTIEVNNDLLNKLE